MEPIRAIVVEDERLPRLTLLQKLEDFRHEVEVVDSCDNYDSALKSILHWKPELLFLDIQLQGRNSIELLEQVRETQPLPYVIFTTAYNDRHYLMSAIKLAAVDYLLKPIEKNELALAIAKVEARRNEVRGERREERGERKEERIVFRTVNGKLFLHEEEIAYIRADGNYSKLTTFGDEEEVLDSLAVVERRLDNKVFVRVDRSTIVNTRQLYKLNTRRRVCTLRSEEGVCVDLELSKAGMAALQTMIP